MSEQDDFPFAPGLIYEDCAFHPVLCTFASQDEDELQGISLLDGSWPRSCSPAHCGPVPLTLAEALEIKRDFCQFTAEGAEPMFDQGTQMVFGQRAQPGRR